MSNRHDTHDQDMADGINLCLKKDGGNTATSNLPMGGFKHTNVAVAAARTDYARFSDLQDGKGIYVPTVGGTADAITLTTGYSVSAYAAGQTFRFIAGGTNTGAATVNVDAIGAKDIKRRDLSALSAGDILSGALVVITYDGTRFQIESAGYTVGGADVAIADGGTAASTATAAFNNLSPVTTRGDIIVRGAANNQRLAVGAANQVLVSDGTDPAWGTVAASDTLAGFIEIGVQSEMEAASSNARAVTPGRQHFHPGHPKAGGNLNGSGTPAFAAGDYGMGAVTDNGTGDYTVAFDTAFANANYWLAGFGRCDTSSTIQTGILSANSSASKTTSAIRLKGFDVGGGSLGADADLPEMGMTFWGDYA